MTWASWAWTPGPAALLFCFLVLLQGLPAQAAGPVPIPGPIRGLRSNSAASGKSTASSASAKTADGVPIRTIKTKIYEAADRAKGGDWKAGKGRAKGEGDGFQLVLSEGVWPVDGSNGPPAPADGTIDELVELVMRDLDAKFVHAGKGRVRAAAEAAQPDRLASLVSRTKAVVDPRTTGQRAGDKDEDKAAREEAWGRLRYKTNIRVEVEVAPGRFRRAWWARKTLEPNVRRALELYRDAFSGAFPVSVGVLVVDDRKGGVPGGGGEAAAAMVSVRHAQFQRTMRPDYVNPAAAGSIFMDNMVKPKLWASLAGLFYGENAVRPVWLDRKMESAKDRLPSAG